MQAAIITQLNQLNQEFYSQTSEYFNNSRQYYWQGWENLLPTLNKKFAQQNHINVLDLGCGNGRFGSFICENVDKKINYLGIDSSASLLTEAEKRLSGLPSHCNFRMQESDIIEAALNNTFLQSVETNTIDLIVMFGVWHHIPSHKLRQSLLTQLAQLLKSNGLLIFTTWKFYEYQRFKKKIIPPKKAGINPEDLEENDFILDWKRGTNAYRYCHYSTDAEIELILNAIPKLTQIDSFRADSKQNNVNQYIVLEKNLQESVQ